MGWKPFKKPFGNRSGFFRKSLRALGPIAGAGIGTMMGGPLGGVIGGGLAGGAKGGDIFKNSLMGAGMGLGYGAIAPGVAQFGGASPFGMMGKLSGLGSPSLLNQLGISSAPGFGGGLGLLGNMGQPGILGGSGLSGILGSKMNGPLGILGKSGILELLGGLSGSKGGYESEAGPSEMPEEEWESMGVQGGKPIKPKDEEASLREALIKNQIIGPSDSNATAMQKLSELLGLLEKTTLSAQKKGNLPPVSRVRKFSHQYKDGGYVGLKSGGPVDGDSGGQDDKVPKTLKEGDFVMDATTISLLGDGNTNNGFKKVRQLENRFLKSGIVRDYSHGENVKTINARVSPGEHIIEKEIVDSAGNGSNKQGVKILNNFRDNLRKHKGVVKFLPPKSKPFNYYLNVGRIV